MVVNMMLIRTNPIAVKKGVLLTIESSTFKPVTTVNSPNPTRTEMTATTKSLVRRSVAEGDGEGTSDRIKYTRAYQATKSSTKGISSFKRVTYDQTCRNLVTRSITMTNRGTSSLTRLKARSDRCAR